MSKSFVFETCKREHLHFRLLNKNKNFSNPIKVSNLLGVNQSSEMNKPSPVTEDKVAAQEAKELRRKQKKDAIEEEEKRKLAEEVRSLAAKQEAERRIAKERQENLKRKEKAVMGEERKLAGQDEEARLTVAKPGAERHDAEDKLEIQRRRRADAARRLAGREVEAAPSCPTVVVVVDVALSCSKVVETAPNCHKADEGSPGGLEENKIEKIVDVGLCNCNEARKMRLLGKFSALLFLTRFNILFFLV